ncbi:hypothetical protein ACKQTC_07345 [Peptococcus simiae]|uniref:Uncharacterized protein n=1 Tax=Peptococcus simiae TaxID=1643805 RepID=A0ABW9H0H5_9FIRM
MSEILMDPIFMSKMLVIYAAITVAASALMLIISVNSNAKYGDHLLRVFPIIIVIFILMSLLVCRNV